MRSQAGEHGLGTGVLHPDCSRALPHPRPLNSPRGVGDVRGVAARKDGPAPVASGAPFLAMRSGLQDFCESPALTGVDNSGPRLTKDFALILHSTCAANACGSYLN